MSKITWTIIDDKTPRSQWKLAKVIELLNGHDNNVRGALVRTTQGSMLKRPVNKLYPIECIKYNEVENDLDNTITHSSDITQEIDERRPRRDAAVVGELRRKFGRE